jgi:hypothetical protein
MAITELCYRTFFLVLVTVVLGIELRTLNRQVGGFLPVSYIPSPSNRTFSTTRVLSF